MTPRRTPTAGTCHIIQYSQAMNDVVECRRRAGLTQAALAGRSGVAQPNIAAYENGTRRASEAMRQRLRDAAAPRPSIVLERHRKEILEIARRHKASVVRVFGSVARGEDVSGSDLDLLVRFEPDADVFDLADLTLALQDLLGVKVDVVSDRGLTERGTDIRHEAIAL